MLPIVLLVLLYIAVAALIGWIGRGRKFGAWGYFFAGILLTPVISILLVCASDRRPVVRQG
jgi:hypothetical protein